MGLGNRLIQLRKEKGYTRESFAEILEISPYTLRNYELEVTDPGHPFLIKVADLFNVSIDYLMGVTEEREKMTSYSLKSSEYEIIEKYRFIKRKSPDGIKIVDAILDREYSVAVQMQEQADKIKKLETEISEEFIPRRIFAYYGKNAAAGTSYGFGDVIAGTKEYPLNEINENADYTIGVSGNSMEPTFCDGDIVYVKKVSYCLNIGDVGIFQKDNGIYIKRVSEDGLISDNAEYKPMVNGGDVVCLGKVLGKAEEN